MAMNVFYINCTLNSVSGDQVNNTYNSVPRSLTSRPDRHHPLHGRDLTRTPSQRNGTILLPDVISLTTTSMNLIDDIVRLMDDREFIHTTRGLRSKLNSLNSMLHLVESAIKVYERTPLGQSLVDNIYPHVDRCYRALQDVSKGINHYKGSLLPTLINWTWCYVCWVGGDMRRWKRWLSRRQIPLKTFLMALNSVEWTKFGDALLSDGMTFEQFSALVKPHLPFLRRVQVDTVVVVDHLGQNIPVPVLFCSRWKDFDYIIYGYCKARAGNRYIERGDYQVMNVGNRHIIDPAKFPGRLEPGTILEMSIILRQYIEASRVEKECPRCHRVNSSISRTDDWVECSWCSGNFRVAVDQKQDTSDVEHQGQNSEERFQPNGETYDRTIHEGLAEEADKTAVGDDVEQLVSPAVGCSNQNSDETQYFCRIVVIRTPVDSVGDGDVLQELLAEDHTEIKQPPGENKVDVNVPHENDDDIVNFLTTEHLRTKHQPKGSLQLPRRAGSDIIILVMGQTGVGKSTFISLAAGKDVAFVGHDLNSCTAEIQTISFPYPQDPSRNVILVDTPGFDNSYINDLEISEHIADWLRRLHKKRQKLCGIIYLHDITQHRTSGPYLKNLIMFRTLCGEKSSRNVVLVTTKWDLIQQNLPTGWDREKALEKIWANLLRSGSRTHRFNGTPDSAWAIINDIIAHDPHS